MAKIAKTDAFKAVTEAISSNDIKTANAIFAIVSKSIENDRKSNNISEYIELTSKQKKYFNGKYNKFLQ